jgi:hypothetical protein
VSDQTIHQGINRNVRHITTITCVAASDEDLIPYIIMSHKSKPPENEFKKRGIAFGLHMTVVGRQKRSVIDDQVERHIGVESFPDAVQYNKSA